MTTETITADTSVLDLLMKRAAALPAVSHVDPEAEAIRQEEALIAQLVAQAQVELPDPTTVEEAQAQLAAQEKVAQEAESLRRRAANRYQAAQEKLQELKKNAEKKERWRMYQVWRIIDAEGYTDWTPGGNHREGYALKEVGQVIDFRTHKDTLNMCRQGTHMARFAYEAATSHVGERLVRLELEGWLDRSSYFKCETAKVLAIIDINDLMQLPKAAPYTEDTPGQALRRYLEKDSGLYIDPNGGPTSQRDRWRQYFLDTMFKPLVEKVEADEAYQPSGAEMLPVLLVAEKAGLADYLFGITLHYPDSDSIMVGYFARAIRKSREERAKRHGQTRHSDSCSPAQTAMHNTERKELELKARAYVKEHYPGVVIKDFGVSRGKDALDPNAGSSPKYWMSE